MSLSYNSQNTVIIGNVGRDPELRYTPQGVAVCDFSVAVNETSGKGENRQQKTTWFKVSVWREKAETASQHIHKGMLILIEGTVSASAYTNKQGQPTASLELRADNFKFLDSKQDGEGKSSGYQKRSNGSGPSASGDENPNAAYESVDDIPF